MGRSPTCYSPVRRSPPKWFARLACIRHAASVHPEPESNPPQKTFMESQQTALKKKKDGPSNKEGRSHKNPDTHQTPSGTTRAGIGLAIKNHKPHPHGCDPWQVVQYTLLSSQTTKHTHNPDPEEPDQTASGSKRKTYTTTPTNTTHRRVATHKTQQPQHLHRRVTQPPQTPLSTTPGARTVSQHAQHTRS